LIDESNILFQ
jgi:hypothetical protein